MKKLLAICLLLGVMLGTVACQSNAFDKDNNEKESSSDPNESALTPSADGASESSVLTEAQKAAVACEAALKGRIKVYDRQSGESVYLKDYPSPYYGRPLCELGELGYASMDVNGDAVNELVIDCGDTLILRYFEDRVYVYAFTFRNLYDLKTDGSYSWNDTGESFEYGESRLVFDGENVQTEVLWRIVHDVEQVKEAYYIGDEQVAKEEILKYFDDNPKEKVSFAPLEESWKHKISYDTALALAEKHWESVRGDSDYGITRGNNASAPSNVYVFVLRKVVPNGASTPDEVWIDKNTGAAITPYFSDKR